MRIEKEFEAEKEWKSAIENFGVDPKKGEEIFNKIVRMYDSEKRFYHNRKHVEKLLKFIEGKKDEIENFDAVCLATWFHDVIYDTQAKDNEEQSAIFARKKLEELGIQKDIIVKVEKLIRATWKHENIDGDNDCSIFLDGDLAILSEDNDKYDSYTKAIRREYAWVPDDVYKERRKEVMENFLKKDRIYFTEEMFKKSEVKARNNIKREIESLQ